MPLTTLKNLLLLLDKRSKVRLIGLFFLVMASALLEMIGIGLFLPLLQIALTPEKINDLPFLGEIYQNVAGGDQGRMLILFSGCLLAFYVLKNFALGIIVYVQKKFAYRAEAVFRTRLFHTYLLKPLTFHLNRNSADIIRTLMRSAVVMFTNILIPIMELVTESLLSFAAIAVLLIIEPVGTLAAMVLFGSVLGGVYFLIRRHLSNWGRRQETLTAQIYLWINQGLGAVKETKVLGRESFFVDAFADRTMKIALLRLYAAIAHQFPRLLGEVLVLSSMMAVIVIVVLQKGTMNDVMPVMGVFAAAAFRVMPSFNRIINSASTIRQNEAALENILIDLDYRPPAPAAADTSVPVLPFSRQIEVLDVSYRYADRSTAALDRISLAIGKGETVGLVGTSGSGKTTLVDVVLGLLEPQQGSLLVDGEDVGVDPRRWQRQIGFVPQAIYLSDDTLRRNIAFGLPDEAIDEEKVTTAVRLAQLEDLVADLPQGLDTLVGERGARLSGGQRQRVGIARALYDEPQVLVFDEATSALDSETESKINKVIRDFRGERTLIIIAHRLSTVCHCDRLVFLENGRMVDCGTFDELLARCPAFRRLAELGEHLGAGAAAGAARA